MQQLLTRYKYVKVYEFKYDNLTYTAYVLSNSQHSNVERIETAFSITCDKSEYVIDGRYDKHEHAVLTRCLSNANVIRFHPLGDFVDIFVPF